MGCISDPLTDIVIDKRLDTYLNNLPNLVDKLEDLCFRLVKDGDVKYILHEQIRTLVNQIFGDEYIYCRYVCGYKSKYHDYANSLLQMRHDVSMLRHYKKHSGVKAYSDEMCKYLGNIL